MAQCRGFGAKLRADAASAPAGKGPGQNQPHGAAAGEVAAEVAEFRSTSISHLPSLYSATQQVSLVVFFTRVSVWGYQLHAPTLLRASMGMVVGAVAWQQRLYALKLAREVVTRYAHNRGGGETRGINAEATVAFVWGAGALSPLSRRKWGLWRTL